MPGAKALGVFFGIGCSVRASRSALIARRVLVTGEQSRCILPSADGHYINRRRFFLSAAHFGRNRCQTPPRRCSTPACFSRDTAA
jgi:hypothetical protein